MHYNPESVERLTGAKGDTAVAFITANPIPYDFARSASQIEIDMWIRNSYKVWRKNN